MNDERNTMNGKLFNKVSKETLNILKEIVLEKKPTFLIPTRFISKENVQLAFLINEYLNYGKDDKERELFRSFFVSSRYEAFQGAIKLMRCNSHNATEKILVLDSNKEIDMLVNPFKNEDEMLIPGVVVVDSVEQFKAKLNKEQIFGAIIMNLASVSSVNNIISICKERNIISLLMYPEYDFQSGNTFESLRVLPDMFIFGESMVDYEVPFAVFSMTEKIHKPWIKMSTSLLHSSTYSGNKLSVTKALIQLQKTEWFSNDKKLMSTCNKIGSSPKQVIKAFSRYINPGMVRFYKLLGYDFICEQAKGSNLAVKDHRNRKTSLLDAVSGGGAACCGHSPEGVIDICENHDIYNNYSEELQEKLNKVFNLRYYFPAVSGATAVEAAIILGLLASGKKRILTFNDNYSGNTLISLICCGDEELQQLFYPMYPEVIFVDPFAENAKQTLEMELNKGDIALVWMELVQGSSLREIPKELLDIISEKKKQFEYYIGTDEILMGFFRLGEITSYRMKGVKPDIVTFSKALTASSFPVAATLVSEEIYNKAVMANGLLVERLKAMYENQFGANIALYSINKLLAKEQIDRIRNVGEILEKGFEEIFEETDIFKEIKGKSHIYALEYKKEWMSYYFCKKAIKNRNTFLYIDRIAVSLTMTEEQAKMLIENLKALYKIRHPRLFKLKGIFIDLWMTVKFLIS